MAAIPNPALTSSINGMLLIKSSRQSGDAPTPLQLRKIYPRPNSVQSVLSSLSASPFINKFTRVISAKFLIVLVSFVMNELKLSRFRLRGPVYPIGLWPIGTRLATREISMINALSSSVGGADVLAYLRY